MHHIINEQVFHTAIKRAEKKHGGNVNEDLLRLTYRKILRKERRDAVLGSCKVLPQRAPYME